MVNNNADCAFIVVLAHLLTLCGAHECHRDLEPVWSADVGSSPVVSSPFISDVDGDNIPDVLATSFSGQISAVNGRTGLALTGWPLILPQVNFHAGPLLYDVDQDGIMEVLVATTDGRVAFVHANGSLFEGETLQVMVNPFTPESDQCQISPAASPEILHHTISPLMIKRDWFRVNVQHSPEKGVVAWNSPRELAKFTPPSAFENGDSQGEGLWSRYQPGVRPSGLSMDGLSVYIDPHILSTPLIMDFDGDGSDEELVLPVNYYFEHTGLSNSTCGKMPCDELANYLASAVVVLSLKSRQVLFNTVLEFSKRSSQFPAYSLSSPAVAAGTGVVVATSTGSVYHVQSSSAEPQLLVSVDSVPGQVSVGDVNGDGNVEVLVIDRSGNVACKGLAGDLEWDGRVSGTAAAGLRLADVDGDHALEIVLATLDGYVWVLDASTGKLHAGWPVRLPGEVRAPVLLTHIQPEEAGSPDIVVPVLDDKLAVIRAADRCMEVINLGKMVLASVVTSDLLPRRPGLELVVASTDGAVVCLGARDTAGASDKAHRNLFSAWPAEVLACGGTTYYSGKVGVQLTDRYQPSPPEVSGRWQTVEFEIRDQRPLHLRRGEYHIKIFTGNKLMATRSYSNPGLYREVVPALFRPHRAMLTVRLTIPGGDCFQDSLVFSYNLHAPDVLAWLLAVPFLTMVTLLLLLHGQDPSTDLLPT